MKLLVSINGNAVEVFKIIEIFLENKYYFPYSKVNSSHSIEYIFF